ncbi:MAG: hypothetical protein QOC78_331 [Solirubrobacteraceae bacterium]|jgi:uncharacterized protein YdeI (YjbR/CyaY-like superfamily)|nr:hypothetical protein [Solirubrobacteraceae bacterium]
MRPTFFATPDELRAWLAAHHEVEAELWVGFHKKGSGLPSVTWPEAVDQALCVGWIDGVRKSLGDTSYAIRFTPRKPSSTWSGVNVRRFAVLREDGLVLPAGEAAFDRRREDRTAIYAYEQRRAAALSDDDEARFRANAPAWEFFSAQPPWYRRTAIHWVVSAKRAETRERRLAQLVDDSEHERTIRRLTRPGRASS